MTSLLIFKNIDRFSNHGLKNRQNQIDRFFESWTKKWTKSNRPVNLIQI